MYLLTYEKLKYLGDFSNHQVWRENLKFCKNEKEILLELEYLQREMVDHRFENGWDDDTYEPNIKDIKLFELNKVDVQKYLEETKEEYLAVKERYARIAKAKKDIAEFKEKEQLRKLLEKYPNERKNK